MFRSDYNQMIHLIINRKLINNYFYNKSSVMAEITNISWFSSFTCEELLLFFVMHYE